MRRRRSTMQCLPFLTEWFNATTYRASLKGEYVFKFGSVVHQQRGLSKDSHLPAHRRFRLTSLNPGHAFFCSFVVGAWSRLLFTELQFKLLAMSSCAPQVLSSRLCTHRFDVPPRVFSISPFANSRRIVRRTKIPPAVVLFSVFFFPLTSLYSPHSTHVT